MTVCTNVSLQVKQGHKEFIKRHFEFVHFFYASSIHCHLQTNKAIFSFCVITDFIHIHWKNIDPEDFALGTPSDVLPSWFHFYLELIEISTVLDTDCSPWHVFTMKQWQRMKQTFTHILQSVGCALNIWNLRERHQPAWNCIVSNCCLNNPCLWQPFYVQVTVHWLLRRILKGHVLKAVC